MFFRHLLGQSRGPLAAGTWPPRSVQSAGPTARERQLEAELAALRAQQTRLAREESQITAQQVALRDALDRLAGEIDDRAIALGDPGLPARGRQMRARIEALHPEGMRPGTLSAFLSAVRIMMGTERAPYDLPAPLPRTALAPLPQQPAPRSTADVVKLVLDAGAKARGEQPTPLPPKGSIERLVIDAGNRARGEEPK
jgi:hypothetical protein